MNTHPYLRAYMAGIPFPSMFMLVIFAGFCVLRFSVDVEVPIERGIVFPLALVPNLWGVWNIVHVAGQTRRHLPLGIHGALLPFVLLPSGFVVLRFVLGVELPAPAIAAGALGFPVVLIAYYLIWKYVVGYLNRMMGIA